MTFITTTSCCRPDIFLSPFSFSFINFFCPITANYAMSLQYKSNAPSPWTLGCHIHNDDFSPSQDRLGHEEHYRHGQRYSLQHEDAADNCRQYHVSPYTDAHRQALYPPTHTHLRGQAPAAPGGGGGGARATHISTRTRTHTHTHTTAQTPARISII